MALLDATAALSSALVAPFGYRPARRQPTPPWAVRGTTRRRRKERLLEGCDKVARVTEIIPSELVEVAIEVKTGPQRLRQIFAGSRLISVFDFKSPKAVRASRGSAKTSFRVFPRPAAPAFRAATGIVVAIRASAN